MNNIVESIDSLLSNNYLLFDNFPYPEGTQLEFKKTFHTNQLEKYRQTICAFLNTSGGHMIFGISNDCSITGCQIKQSDIDVILLFVDSLYEILKKSDGNNIHQNTLKVRFDKIAKNIYLIFISCYKEPNNNNMYQFISGESWIRINASNRKCNLSKLHSIQDIIQIKSKLENVYEKKVSYTIIEIGNILTKKNNFEVNKLEKDLVYYKRLHYYNKLIGFGILFVIIYLVK